MNVDAEITLAETPGLAAHDAILDLLLAFNAAHAAPSDRRPLAVLLRAPGGELLGGLWGETAHGWLLVELLFVPEGLRGIGLGIRLIPAALIADRFRPLAAGDGGEPVGHAHEHVPRLTTGRDDGVVVRPDA